MVHNVNALNYDDIRLHALQSQLEEVCCVKRHKFFTNLKAIRCRLSLRGYFAGRFGDLYLLVLNRSRRYYNVYNKNDFCSYTSFHQDISGRTIPFHKGLFNYPMEVQKNGKITSNVTIQINPFPPTRSTSISITAQESPVVVTLTHHLNQHEPSRPAGSSILCQRSCITGFMTWDLVLNGVQTRAIKTSSSSSSCHILANLRLLQNGENLKHLRKVRMFAYYTIKVHRSMVARTGVGVLGDDI